jgi:hypothetical protein
MSSYMLRGVPPGLVARAKDRARANGTTLDSALLEWLESYADGTDRASVGRKGGAARAASLTPERRAEIAKQGAEARWKGRSVI